MWEKVRTKLGAARAARAERVRRGRQQPEQARRGANMFEAAAEYVGASADGDDGRSAEAASRISPEALFFGVDELACRAVIALARERNESPRAVARDLLDVTPHRVGP